MIELRDLCKRYGDLLAADSVTLDIGRGEFFSLIGPSGCGKTTTLRMIAGFEEPTCGHDRPSAARTYPRAAPPPHRQHGLPGATRCSPT